MKKQALLAEFPGTFFLCFAGTSARSALVYWQAPVAGTCQAAILYEDEKVIFERELLRKLT
jgi:glycerol uptake facilitator-like aquaporin